MVEKVSRKLSGGPYTGGRQITLVPDDAESFACRIKNCTNGFEDGRMGEWPLSHVTAPYCSPGCTIF